MDTVDLLATSISNDVDTVAALIREVVTVEVDDGMVYEPERPEPRPSATIRNSNCPSPSRPVDDLWQLAAATGIDPP
jgi:hypothetical protein